MSALYVYCMYSVKVAWLHNQKGTLAVHPAVIIHNDRISVSDDNRSDYQFRVFLVRACKSYIEFQGTFSQSLQVEISSRNVTHISNERVNGIRN